MKRILTYLCLFLIFLLVSTCKKEIVNSDYPSDNIITLGKAIEMVKQDIPSNKEKGTAESRSNNYQTISTFTINDKNELPAMYIINYVSDGDTAFSIIYADTRVLPLIAFGEGLFVQEEINFGITDWIGDQIEVLELVRDNNYSLRDYLINIVKGREEPDEPCKGQNWTHTVGPLMSTKWGQGCYYNDDLATGCTSHCGHKLVGCVATAMAQIINLHESPNDYNYSLLLNQYSGTSTSQQVNEVAKLMFDTGTSVDMDWTCSGSTPNDYNESTVTDAFVDDFNYSDEISYEDFHYPQPITNNIDNGFPVIFDADNSAESVGHMWACDGYERRNFCVVDDYGNVISGTYLFFHMNWGWNGYNNGWFGYSNLGGLYPDNKYVIVNIKP